MKVSIVIRTFNEGWYLGALLEEILNQKYPPHKYEIIVVDSGSTDSTLSIAKVYANKIISIDREAFTFGHSLNVGIRAAENEYVVIISAHCKPLTPYWLSYLLFPFIDDTVAMTYGRQRGCKISKYSDTTDLQRKYGSEPDYNGEFSNNANSAVRRSLWEHHNFDEKLTGLEDIEWSKFWYRHGYKIVYQPSAVVQHCHDDSWKQVRNRLYVETIAARQLGLDTYGWKDILREIGFCFTDFPKSDNKSETVLFRINKILGMLRGRM